MFDVLFLAEKLDEVDNVNRSEGVIEKEPTVVLDKAALSVSTGVDERDAIALGEEK